MQIRSFHVVVVQERQRNVQQSVMNVRSCCFAWLDLLGFLVCLSFLTFSLPSRRWILGNLHTIPDENLSVIVWTATTRASLSHTLNFKPARLAERVWCTKFQSSLLNIYFRLFSYQAHSLLPMYFRYGSKRCSHCTQVWFKPYPICDATLSRLARRSFVAPSQPEIAPPQSFLCVNRSFIQYHFLGGVKVIWCCMDTALKSLLTWLT